MSLSVTIITRNEAENIAEALQSVAWADERIVVDCGSTDDTVAIARRHADRVVAHPWCGYAAQKNYAAGLAANDWILSLDADERITPALAEEIKRTLSAPPTASGFRMPRVSRHLGRWIRTTDWYPDYQLRLYNRRSGEWAERRVHESVAVRGSVGTLRGELQHFPYRGVADHVETIDRYTTLAAQQMFEEGRRTSFVELAIYPAAAFVRNYLLRGGIRDRTPGLIISSMNAYYVFLKFAKLKELQQQHEASGR